MASAAVSGASSKMIWAGRILSGLIVVLLLLLASFGFFKPEMSRQGFKEMGYPDSLAMPVTIALIASTLLYAIPRTTVLGAILLTGYFGGAIATHLRLGQPTFVVGLSVGILAWLGVYLRDARLRALLPLRT